MVKKEFITQEAPEVLSRLTQDMQALWGIMGPQHMVEHLSLIFYISTNHTIQECITPEEKLPRMRAFLMSDKPLTRNFEAPFLPVGTTSPLRYKDLDEARLKLMGNIDRFYAHFRENPDDESMHPVFGKLNFEGWEQFHYKHLTHHLTQFALLPEKSE